MNNFRLAAADMLGQRVVLKYRAGVGSDQGTVVAVTAGMLFIDVEDGRRVATDGVYVGGGSEVGAHMAEGG